MMKLGAGWDAKHYLKNPAYRELVRSRFDFVIPTWGMMPGDHHEGPQLTVNPLVEEAVNLAISDGLKVYGHCLITRFSFPNWLEGMDGSSMRSLLEEQIYQVVSYWGERISDWVVVNEMIGSSGVSESHPFTKVLGEEAIALAFKTAKVANPNCKLWLSEFGIQNPILWNKVYKIVSGLLRKNTPIDGISAHLHVNLFPKRSKFRIANYAAHLYPYHGVRINLLKHQISRFQKLGLLFHCSEMSVWPDGMNKPKLKAQEAAYNRYLKAAREARSSRASIWSIVDDARHGELSWRWDKQLDYPGVFSWCEDSQTYIPKFKLTV